MSAMRWFALTAFFFASVAFAAQNPGPAQTGATATNATGGSQTPIIVLSPGTPVVLVPGTPITVQ